MWLRCVIIDISDYSWRGDLPFSFLSFCIHSFWLILIMCLINYREVVKKPDCAMYWNRYVRLCRWWWVLLGTLLLGIMFLIGIDTGEFQGLEVMGASLNITLFYIYKNAGVCLVSHHKDFRLILELSLTCSWYRIRIFMEWPKYPEKDFIMVIKTNPYIRYDMSKGGYACPQLNKQG